MFGQSKALAEVSEEGGSKVEAPFLWRGLELAVLLELR